MSETEPSGPPTINFPKHTWWYLIGAFVCICVMCWWTSNDQRIDRDAGAWNEYYQLALAGEIDRRPACSEFGYSPNFQACPQRQGAEAGLLQRSEDEAAIRLANSQAIRQHCADAGQTYNPMTRLCEVPDDVQRSSAPVSSGAASTMTLSRDLDCDDISGSVRITGRDVHNLDADNDGIGCE